MFGLDCCLGDASVCKDQAVLRATELGVGSCTLCSVSTTEYLLVHV